MFSFIMALPPDNIDEGVMFLGAVHLPCLFVHPGKSCYHNIS